MHEHFELISTLTGGLAAALVLGYVTKRVGLSPIVGYLLAGIAVGPHTPGFNADRNLAEQLAEIGVILLMFGVGLHFHVEDLLAVRKIAVPGAIVQSLAATLLGTLVAHAFGWSWSAGLVFGMALSVASTVVLVRVLADHNDLHTPTGHVAVGWLVVEDLFTVAVLVVMPALFGSHLKLDLFTSWILFPFGGIQAVEVGGLPLSLFLTVVKLALLIGMIFVIGGRVIPWLLHRAADTRSRELFTLTVLVVALGIAVGSSKLFGVSMALGAFLAGMVVGRSDFSLRAATEALPMRDAFAVLFFVASGMLFDPAYLWESPDLVAATLGIVLVGKPLAAAFIVLALRYPLRLALAVSVALAQVGEFTFMLAALGENLGVLPEAANNSLVAASIVSITINPLLYRLVDPLSAWISRQPRLNRLLNARADKFVLDHKDNPRSALHRAVLVGHGPVGRTLSRLLRKNNVEPIIVELNLATIQQLRKEGTLVVYGDAGHKETLKSAGLDRAKFLVLSSSGLRNAEEIIRLARELNPKIEVLARCSYLMERHSLRDAGADVVVSGEGEVALAMAEVVLKRLGAVPEQIDRERHHVRTDLFGESDSLQELLRSDFSPQVAPLEIEIDGERQE